MSTIEMLLKEMEQEALTTRKMLERVPSHQFDWQPHKKSMTLQRLATHVAELPSWVEMAVTTDELDFAKNAYAPEVVDDTAGLLEYFERNLARGRKAWQRHQRTLCRKIGPCAMGTKVIPGIQ